ncbi:MAG: methylglyoxal synthase [Chloroflexota bacterium]|nr:methylglyoxal synthase [Chloroflexota bacterium]
MQELAVALIAHDAKKDDMVMLVKAHREEISELDIVATKGTGQLVKARTGLEITLLEDGPYGGDQQVGGKVASGEVKAVIFLRDPLMAQPHEPDISALLRVCDVHNVPLATNLTTAEAILHLIFEHPEESEEPHLIRQFISNATAVHESITEKEVTV